MKLSYRRWTAAAVAIAGLASATTLARSPTVATTPAERLVLAKVDAGQSLSGPEVSELFGVATKLVRALGEACDGNPVAACVGPKPPVRPLIADPSYAKGLKVLEQAVQPNR